MENLLLYFGAYIFFPLALILVPIASQYKAVCINTENFKRIKIKKMKFMFRAMHGGKVDKEGVLIAMFISQILGPLLGVVQLIVGIAFINTNSSIIGLTFLSFIFFEGFYLICVSVILYYMDLKKERLKCNCNRKEYKYMVEQDAFNKGAIKLANLYGKLTRVKKGTKKYDAIVRKIKLCYKEEANTTCGDDVENSFHGSLEQDLAE